jgi:hypothetical protein
MKTKILSILLILSAFAFSASARIGETEAQIEKRYGKPDDTIKSLWGKRCRYMFRGYFVFVDFERGASQSETYAKKDASVIMPTEVVALLNANSEGAAWTNPDLVDGQYISHTKKAPRRVAIYNPISRDLMITSKEFLDRASTSIDAATREKMKGF